jgi:hypothetical protein
MYGLKPVPFIRTLHLYPAPEPFTGTERLSRNGPSYENDEPQPQERVEFGLMKLNPCRISVSS